MRSSLKYNHDWSMWTDNCNLRLGWKTCGFVSVTGYIKKNTSMQYSEVFYSNDDIKSKHGDVEGLPFFDMEDRKISNRNIKKG